MSICENCNAKLAENETIYTDFFQVYGADAKVYTLCGKCYLDDVQKYLEEQKPKCICGAPEVLLYENDEEEIIGMAIHEGVINLICSKMQNGLKEDLYSEEELETLEGNHEFESMHYIRWYSDEEMGWN